MKTDLIIDLLEKEGKHIEENWVKDIPMGRLSHPSELQGTLVYMASDASSYLTGCDLVSLILHEIVHSNVPFANFRRSLTVDIPAIEFFTTFRQILGYFSTPSEFYHSFTLS